MTPWKAEVGHVRRFRLGSDENRVSQCCSQNTGASECATRSPCLSQICFNFLTFFFACKRLLISIHYSVLQRHHEYWFALFSNHIRVWITKLNNRSQTIAIETGVSATKKKRIFRHSTKQNQPPALAQKLLESFDFLAQQPNWKTNTSCGGGVGPSCGSGHENCVVPFKVATYWFVTGGCYQ